MLKRGRPVYKISNFFTVVSRIFIEENSNQLIFPCLCLGWQDNLTCTQQSDDVRPLQLVYMVLVRDFRSSHAGRQVLSNLATVCPLMSAYKIRQISCPFHGCRDTYTYLANPPSKFAVDDRANTTAHAQQSVVQIGLRSPPYVMRAIHSTSLYAGGGPETYIMLSEII